MISFRLSNTKVQVFADNACLFIEGDNQTEAVNVTNNDLASFDQT